MEFVIKTVPILLSLVGVSISVYTLLSTRRDLKKSAERQFLETSSTTCHHILADLNMHAATGRLLPREFIGFVDSEAFNQLISHKQAALRFQHAVWYEDFDGMLTVMGKIGATSGRIARQMRERNLDVAEREMVDVPLGTAVVEAANAVAKYINTARDRLTALG